MAIFKNVKSSFSSGYMYTFMQNKENNYKNIPLKFMKVSCR